MRRRTGKHSMRKAVTWQEMLPPMPISTGPVRAGYCVGNRSAPLPVAVPALEVNAISEFWDDWLQETVAVAPFYSGSAAVPADAREGHGSAQHARHEYTRQDAPCPSCQAQRCPRHAAWRAGAAVAQLAPRPQYRHGADPGYLRWGRLRPPSTPLIRDRGARRRGVRSLSRSPLRPGQPTFSQADLVRPTSR